MKILKTGALCAFLCIFCLGAMAQRSVHEKAIPVNEPDYHKPKLFADLPETVSLNIAALEPLLEAEIGKTVSIPFSKGLTYQGTVISKSTAFDAKTKSVVIKSTNRKGSTFTFSKMLAADGSSSFQGRILSFNNIDAFEIALEKGEYILQKKNLYDLYNE